MVKALLCEEVEVQKLEVTSISKFCVSTVWRLLASKVFYDSEINNAEVH